MFDLNSILLVSLVPTIVIGAVVIIVVAFVLRRVFELSAPNQELLATGESAEATILKLWDTGTSVNVNPLAGPLLEVNAPNRAPYQVETSKLISRLETSQYQPGATLVVKIDPHNPQKVAIAGVPVFARA